MSKSYLFLTMTILLSLSCNSDDDSKDKLPEYCATVLCAAVNNTIYLEFLNDTDENLLENGSIPKESIEVTEKNKAITFSIETLNNEGKVLAFPVSTTTYGPKSFTIDFGGENPFTISLTTSLSEESECCGPYTVFGDISISTYAHDPIEPGILPLKATIHID